MERFRLRLLLINFASHSARYSSKRILRCQDFFFNTQIYLLIIIQLRDDSETDLFRLDLLSLDSQNRQFLNDISQLLHL